jgi:hypothetical protein
MDNSVTGEGTDKALKANTYPKPHHKLHFLVLAMFMLLIVSNVLTPRTSAFLDARSVAVGSSLAGVVTQHAFTFDVVSNPTIGSIAFEYCSNTPLIALACVAPTGLDTSGVSLTTQNGETGFTVHPNTGLTSNRIVIGRAPAGASPGTVSYTFSDAVNPTILGTTYVRITLYSTTDGSGLHDDWGSVTFSIQNPLTIQVYVPPFLTLCSGVTVAVDCSTTNGVTVDLGELSRVAPNSTTTQFSVATNSINGYTTSVQGSTMTAGNRTIAPITLPSVSQPGVAQFGINLRANANPANGQDVVGAGTGIVDPDYNSPNVFKFANGDVVATSSLPTEWNRYTITYLVNVPDNQAAGRYASTLTVIATTTF